MERHGDAGLRRHVRERLFDYYSQAHQYWIFRPGSESDIENGYISEANFSQYEGRTSFGPTTDPHPYLTDGTPENSFEITDIYANGTELTFHVHFFDTGVEEYPMSDNVRVYPNPAADVIQVHCAGLDVLVGSVEVFDVYGKLLNIANVVGNPANINVSALSPGIYFLRLTTNQGIVTKRFVKQ